MWQELTTLWQNIRAPEYLHLLLEPLPLYGLGLGLVFVIVSLDFQKAAQELHAEQAIRKCIHVFASTQGKELSIVRTPAHFVIAADGKVLMATEEEVAPYMSLVL